MTYHEIDNGIGGSLHSVILWQYEDATTLKAFIESMCEAAYLAVDDFWDKWAVFRMNVDKAATMDDGFGLSVLGATCGIPRPNNISNSMYAKLIKCRMKLSMTTAATTVDYKAYMDELFGGYATMTENPQGVVMSVSTTCSASSGSSDADEIDAYNLYHSEDSNAYGKYWLVLPTGVKRGISSWGGIVFGFDDHAAGTDTNSRVPAIGPFGTKFMTSYQYEYVKGDRA